MELSQLRYFRELARREHLTKTAQFLSITPPSLSVSISKLEQELGTRLFERSGRSIRLNADGKLFLEHVDQALETLEIGRQKLQAGARSDLNSLQLGVTAQTLWLNGIQAFTDRYPQISVSRESVYLNQLNDHTQMAQFNFVLTALQDLPSQEWEHCILVPDDTYMLVLSKGHPWAGRTEITLEEAASEPFVLLSKNHSSRRMSDGLFDAARIRPYIIAECDYMLRAQLLHTEKRAVSITSRLGMTSALLSDLDAIPIRTTATRRTQALFWPRGRQLSFAELTFKEFLYHFYAATP